MKTFLITYAFKTELMSSDEAEEFAKEVATEVRRFHTSSIEKFDLKLVTEVTFEESI